MKNLQMASWILLIVGGLNWGLVGLGGFFGGNWNIVYLIFGAWPAVEWAVYILVGAAAVHQILVRRQNTSPGGMM